MSQRDNENHLPEAGQTPKNQLKDHCVCVCDHLTHDHGSSSAFAEDQTTPWLEYPLDDCFQKNHSADLFVHWHVLEAQTYKEPLTMVNEQTAATFACGGSRRLIGNAENYDRLGNAGYAATSVSLQKSASADAALALGAGRAAGLIDQAGFQAFRKVRTSMQPGATNLGSSSSLTIPKDCVLFPACSSRQPSADTSSPWLSMLPPRSRQFGSPSGRLLLQPTQGGIRNCGNLPPSGAVMMVDSCPKGMALERQTTGGSNSTDSSLAESSTTAAGGERSRNNFDKHLLTQPGGSTRFLERSFVLSAKGEVAEQAATTDSTGVDVSGLRPTTDTVGGSNEAKNVISRLEKTTDAREGPELAMASYSEGSQISAEKMLEERSFNGKRKSEDWECHSEDAEEESVETRQLQARTTSKRSRAADIHNLSERRRRDRINEKMRALQELIPNSNKTDKASMLDEAIEYLKMLQVQLQMMSIRSGVSMPPMLLPIGMPHMQMPQATHLHPVAMGMSVEPMRIGTGASLGTCVGMMDIGHVNPGRPVYTLPSHPAEVCSTSGATNIDVHLQASTVAESSPIYISHLQVPPQSFQPMNMDIYSLYLLQQQQQTQHDSQHINQLPGHLSGGSSQ